MQTKAQQYHDAIGEDDIARNDDVRLKQSPVPEDLFAYTCIYVACQPSMSDILARGFAPFMIDSTVFV